MDHVLPREPRRSATRWACVLAAEGVELHFGQHASAARREGEDYVLELADGAALRGDRLLVATGRRPRVRGLGLETVGVGDAPTGSRSTGAWPPATGCGRSATSPGCGR